MAPRKIEGLSINLEQIPDLNLEGKVEVLNWVCHVFHTGKRWDPVEIGETGNVMLFLT
jgi:hypothetical protein